MRATRTGREWATLKLGTKKLKTLFWRHVGAIPVDDSRKVLERDV